MLGSRFRRRGLDSARSPFIVAGILAGLGGISAPARATCGSANCFLVTGTQEGVAGSGILTVDLSYRYVDMDRKLSGSHRTDDVLTPKVDFENGVLDPDHHREIRTQNSLVEIDLAYGLTPRLTLAAALPIINQRDHEHFDDANTPTPIFTNQDGSSGFGDVRLGARYAFLVRSKNILVGGLGVKLATGQYRLLDGEGNINEPTIQPGTGSTDAVASLYFAHQVAPMRIEWFLSGASRKNGENGLDYRFGDETVLSVGFDQKTGERATWSVQVNGRRTLHDTFLGRSVPSTGSTFINLTPGVRLSAGSGASIYGFVQVPVYQEVNEVNLAPGIGLQIGVSKAF